MANKEENLEELIHLIGISADMAAINAVKAGKTQAEIVRSALQNFMICGIRNGMIQIAHREFWPDFILTSPPYSPMLR